MVFASFVCRAAGALALAAACSAHAADLTLTIEGVNATEGRVAAAAYDSAGSWLKGPPAAVAQADAASPRTVLVLRDVPPGPYGVTVIHDRNANGKLDSNIVGIPTEPYGAIRHARGRMGPPAFEDAAVDVQGDTALTIHLH